MKTILKFSLLAVAAFALSSCTPPANTNTNSNANTNANMASKPAAPTADSLMALENKAWDAYKNRDGKYFETFLADMPMISGTGEASMPKAEVVKMIAANKDEIKSFTLSDPHVTPVNADVAVLTYKGVVEGTSNGKPVPSPVTVATVFVRSGSDWKAAYHNEVAVVEAPKADAAKKDSTAATGDKKDDDMKADAAGDDKKDAAATTEKKEATAAPASNSNSVSNSNSATSSSDAALTDALMVVEKKGWDGWKAKDAKAFEDILAKDFGFVDTMGKATLNRADVIKMWTTDNPCNVSSVSLSDAKSQSLTSDTAILVLKGTAVGTCGDMKIEPLWNTTVFVKEGGVWKAAYIFESPVAKS